MTQQNGTSTPDVIEAGSGRSLTRIDPTEPIASRMHPPAGALAPYTPTDLDEAADDYGMEGDLRAPFYPYNGKLGKFVHPLTGEVTEHVRLVILRRLSDSRIAWNPEMKAPDREKILCASDDTIVAREARDPEEQARRDALGITGICATCPMKEFGRDKYGDPTKPPCSFYVNLAVAEADDEEPIPYHLGIKSTGLKAILPLLDRWRLLRIAKAVKHIPGFALVFDLYSAEEEGTPPLTYFPLHARIIGDTAPRENWPGLAALQRAIRGLPIDITAQIIESDAPPAEDQIAPDMYGEEPPIETPEEFAARMDAEEAEAAARAGTPSDAPSRAAAAPEPDPVAATECAFEEAAAAASAAQAAPTAEPTGTLPGMGPARSDPADHRKGGRK